MPIRRRIARKRPAPRGPARKRAGARPARRVARPRVRRPRVAATIIGTAVGSTMSSYKSPTRPFKLKAGLAALGVPSTLVISNGYHLEPFGGNQAQLTVGQWFSLADITQMAGRVAYSTYTEASASPTRFHIHSLMAEMSLLNASNAALTVDIYDVIAKQDLPTSTVSGPTYNVSTPVNAWSQGLANQLTNPSLPPNCTSGTQVMGSKPMDSQLFQDYYKITSHKTVLMAQGGQHLHKVNLSVNRTLDLNQVGVASQYLEGMAGLTQFTFVSVRGQPAFINQDPPFTSTSNFSLRVVATERYLYSWVQSAGKTSSYTNGNMFTITAPANIGILGFNSATAEDVVLDTTTM